MFNQPHPQPSFEKGHLLRQRAEARFAECAMPMPATDLPVWAASWQPDATWRALAFRAPGAIMAVNEVA